MQDNLRRLLSDFVLAGIQFELEENITIKNDEKIAEIPAVQPAQPTAAPIIPKSEPIAKNELLIAAQALAAAANSIEELISAIKNFDRQPTAKLAKNIIPPRAGTADGVLVITDAPTKDDDEAGAIMSGANGEMFGKMMAAIGLDMNEISIFPVMFHKLPGDRTPTNDELAVANAFFEKFISIVRPKFILTLGQTAFSFAMPDGGTLPKSRGREFDAHGAKLVPTFGLKLLLTKPEHKKDAWADIQKFKELI